MLRRQAGAACLLASGTLLFVAAGGAGRLWPAVAEFGTHKVLSVGIWCCGVPGAYALASAAGGLGRSSGCRPLGIVWLVVGLAGLAYYLDLPERWEVTPMEIGLGSEREAVVKVIREGSTPEGRILWEDMTDPRPGAGWSALLPELTQRPFLGGLTPDACLDHLHVRLADGRLVGRPIEEWTDEELHVFLDRYNVTRAICRSPEALARFHRFASAKVIANLKPGELIVFDRRPSYFLKGRGQVTQMDWKRVALAELEPDETGVVVLSLHHHTNWHVSPGYVSIEKDVDANDPIPLIRLRIPGPISRRC